MSGSEATFSDDGTYDFISDDSAISEVYSIPPEELDALQNDLEARPDELVGRSIEYSDSENGDENGTPEEQSAVENECDSDTEDMPIPRGKSIAHHYITNRRLVYCSFDIETGGEQCGIVQISAEIFRIQNGSGEREVHTFNEYVKPGPNALWNTAACNATHGLHASHPSIVSAESLHDVWNNFCSFIDRNIGRSEVGVLVAWNGEGCDLDWIYKVAQAPRSLLSFPSKLKFFLDPLRTMKYYKGCRLHPSVTKLQSYSLGSVFKYMTDKVLEGAHDSLVDVKAQTTIVLDERFIPYINKTKSIRSITDIFQKKDQKRMNKEAEPTRDVHERWVELPEGSTFTWSPPRSKSYDGSNSGGREGPTSAMKAAALKNGSLLDVFFFFFPFALFKKIAKWTDYYAYKENVVECKGYDCDGKPNKKRMYKPCKANDPNKTKRAAREPIKFPITTGYVITWIGIVILHGALSDSSESIRKYYYQLPEGVYYPIIQNAMTRDAFEFMRRFIHLSDNKKKRPKKGERGWTPLAKVKEVFDTIMIQFRKAWTAGMRVTIDESMIKYMGRAISFVQFMPAKPIKHGIKVFCLCCAYTAMLLGFEIYLGKESKPDKEPEYGAATNVVLRLIDDANLTSADGRVLYTDNWYTSIELAKLLYERYHWTVVGTMSLTEKKSREGEDIPFVKLSNGALHSVERGWFREAVLKVKTKKNHEYYIQATTWRDKKQVLFVHTHCIGRSSDVSVKRHVKGRKGRVTLQGTNSQQEYSKYFNAVDRNDRDSSDYSVSLRTAQWYLRLLFWLADRVVHGCYIVVTSLKEEAPHWKIYAKRNNGRRRMQIHLGIALIRCGIELDWKNPSDPKGRPKWVRKNTLPCNCKHCFFCKIGKTTGIFHDRSKVNYESKNGKKKRVPVHCTFERETINDYSNYCWQCMKDLQPPESELPFVERKKLCSTSRLGCLSCRKPVCEDCWEKWSNNYERHRPVRVAV